MKRIWHAAKYNHQCQFSCYFKTYCISSTICFFSNNIARVHHFIDFRWKNCLLLQTFIPLIEHSLRNALNLCVDKSIAQTLSSYSGHRMWHLSLKYRTSLKSWPVNSPRHQTQSNVKVKNTYVNMTQCN